MARGGGPGMAEYGPRHTLVWENEPVLSNVDHCLAL
jgi:hypothetical protein